MLLVLEPGTWTCSISWEQTCDLVAAKVISRICTALSSEEYSNIYLTLAGTSFCFLTSENWWTSLQPWWKSADAILERLRNSWRHLDLPSTFLLFGGNGYGFIDKEDGESMFAESSILSVSNSRSKKQDMLQLFEQLCNSGNSNGGDKQFISFSIFTSFLSDWGSWKNHFTS